MAHKGKARFGTGCVWQGMRTGDSDCSLSMVVGALWGTPDPMMNLRGRFVAEYEVAGMRVSTFEFEAMVLHWKTVTCFIRLGVGLFPRCRCWSISGYCSQVRVKCECSTGGIVPICCDRELSLKAKRSVYQYIYIPTLTHGCELWVVTWKNKITIQAAEMSFLYRVTWLNLRNKVPNVDIWRDLGVELQLLHLEMSQLRCFRHMIRMLPGPPIRGTGHVQWTFCKKVPFFLLDILKMMSILNV